MLHEINGIEYDVMGGIITPQQFDFARQAVYDFVKYYAKAVKDGVNSVFLSFPLAKDMNQFLAAIIVPTGEQWSMETYKQTITDLTKQMIDPEVLEAVVNDFFLLNAKWVGISPALQEAKNRMMAMVGVALVKENMDDSKDITNALKSLSTFMNTSSLQPTET